MNPFEMVVLIVGISAVASVLRAKYGVVRKGRGRDREEIFVGRADDIADPDRLRGEDRQLKNRIQVLDRIVTDGDTKRSVALEREIDALRLEKE